MDRPRTAEECLKLVCDLIDEAQREANHCVLEYDRCQILAKRDALTELKLRIKEGRANHRWARQAIITGSLPL